jgi:methylmalonyl-CoA/ethylmalonyl-CoA epimerase
MNPLGLILQASSRFHHVGVACRDLEREQDGLRALGYVPVGKQFTDSRQGVVGVFLEGPGPRLELLAPFESSGVLDPWLRGRARMYHLAYEVSKLNEAISAARDAGARQMSAPTPAVAFGDRHICFVMLRNLLLVELIEAEKQDADVRRLPWDHHR